MKLVTLAAVFLVAVLATCSSSTLSHRSRSKTTQQPRHHNMFNAALCQRLLENSEDKYGVEIIDDDPKNQPINDDPERLVNGSQPSEKPFDAYEYVKPRKRKPTIRPSNSKESVNPNENQPSDHPFNAYEYVKPRRPKPTIRPSNSLESVKPRRPKPSDHTSNSQEYVNPQGNHPPDHPFNAHEYVKPRKPKPTIRPLHSQGFVNHHGRLPKVHRFDAHEFIKPHGRHHGNDRFNRKRRQTPHLVNKALQNPEVHIHGEVDSRLSLKTALARNFKLLPNSLQHQIRSRDQANIDELVRSYKTLRVQLSTAGRTELEKLKRKLIQVQKQLRHILHRHGMTIADYIKSQQE